MTSLIVFLFFTIISNAEGTPGVGYGMYMDQETCLTAFATMEEDAAGRGITIRKVLYRCEAITMGPEGTEI